MAEMRENLRHFFNIGTSSNANYVLLGDGVTSLTEEMNPESETKQYIHEKNKTTTIKSYAPSISIEKEYIKDEDLQEWMNTKIAILPTGSSAESDYIRVNLFEEVSGSTGTYKAVKRKCSYQFDSIGGEAGGELMNNMTLGGVGDPIQGTFDISTKTFTATT